MSIELSTTLRRAAITDLPRIIDAEFGILASGEGRYKVFFCRDATKSIILFLSRDQKEINSQLLEAAIRSQETAIAYEGNKFDARTEEAPGKKPHEIHTRRAPQERLADLKDKGWPVFTYPDGSLGMINFFTNDATSLFNISVAVIYSVIKKQNPKNAQYYLENMWPA